MKKIISLFLCVAMVLSLCLVFASCGDKEDTKKADDISDTMTSEDGKYLVAFVTDIGQLKDKSFNQGTWDGVKSYAYKNGKSYKYYQPANGEKATDADRVDAMISACTNGAEVVVCAGYLQETALKTAAIAYPNVKFVFIDGYPLSNGDAALTNVAGISFKEEQSGYFAGYAAVMEGYTKLGFTGGGGGTNPACCRFGYGYVQGAQAAAAKKNVQVEVKYSWLYGSSYSASTELQTLVSGWYTNGTEVIFACGGSMCNSVFAAASENDKYAIGVDVDQSGDSDTVITSATKGLSSAVEWALAKFYDGKWDEIGGKGTSLGAADDATGLPTATWSLKNFSVEDYEALLKDVKDGKISIADDYSKFTKADFVAGTFSNVTVDFVE